MVPSDDTAYQATLSMTRQIGQENGTLHLRGVRQGQQPVHRNFELLHAAPTAKVSSVNQDVASRHCERLGVGIRDTHKSRPALTRMWGYIVPIVVMDDNAGGGMVALRRGRTRAVEKACNEPRTGHRGNIFQGLQRCTTQPWYLNEE